MSITTGRIICCFSHTRISSYEFVFLVILLKGQANDLRAYNSGDEYLRLATLWVRMKKREQECLVRTTFRGCER